MVLPRHGPARPDHRSPHTRSHRCGFADGSVEAKHDGFGNGAIPRRYFSRYGSSPVLLQSLGNVDLTPPPWPVSRQPIDFRLHGRGQLTDELVMVIAGVNVAFFTPLPRTLKVRVNIARH